MRRIPPDVWAMAAVIAVVVCANLPSVLAGSAASPFATRGELASATPPGWLPGEPTIDPNDGFTSQALGHRAALDVVHLRWPWWNPYEGTGAPLAGELQSAALFPPTLLTLFAGGQVYERMLLEIVAGLSTFLLLRRLSLNRFACVAAAIAFALDGTFAWLANAPVNAVAFLPLLLLGLELAFAASAARRRGGWWLIAVAGALSFYAGFPEVAYIDALLGVCWFAWRCGCLERARVRAFALKAAAGTAVGVLLSAPLLVAAIDYLGAADLAGHAGGAAGSGHLPAQALPQLVLPYVYGPIFAFGDPNLTLTRIWGSIGGYLSTSLLVFALVGLSSRGRRGLRLILLGWIVLALCRVYGDPPVLRSVLGVVPGMGRVAFYRYAFPSVELAVTVLAAIGLDAVIQAPSRRRGAALIGLVSLAVVVVAALGARPLDRDPQGGYGRYPYLAGSLVWGASIALAAAGATLVRGARARAWLVTLVVAGDALLLFALPQASAPRSVRVDMAPVRFLEQQLGTSRFFTLGPLQPNYGSYFGLGSLNVDDTPVPSPFATYVHRRLDQAVDPTVFVGDLGGGRAASAPSPAQELLKNLPGYRAAGVKYLLAPAGEPLPESPTTFEQVLRSPTTSIYRLAGAAPYFTTTRGSCKVTTQSREAVRLSCPRPTRLIRHETDLPGWSASVDGHRVRIQRADDLFQSVRIGAGAHRVTFSYSPPHIDWGFAAFAVGAAWLLITASNRRSGRTWD